MKWAVAMVMSVMTGITAHAQVTGSASVMLDVLPDPDEAPQRQTTTELRVRVFAEHEQEAGEHLRFNASAAVEGVIADRRASSTVSDAVIRPVDLYAEWSYPRFDIRAGATRVVWGRLDEIQPTDVVNPIDLTKFLLEGRSEARMAVGVVRARYFLLGSSAIEAVVVPVFRAGRFDQMDDRTSSFNVGAGRQPTIRNEPAVQLGNMQGGVRMTSTDARVDWALTAYRGFRSFPIVTALLTPAGPTLIETFPRFTMIGGDFETVRGPWGLRGEVAAFVADELQASSAPRGVRGKSIDAGVGLDRRAGAYRIGANVLWAWRSADETTELVDADEMLRGSDLTFVVAADRSFARETRTLRVFAVYDPVDATMFGRLIASVSLRDNVWLEGSGGVFTGSSADVLGRLSKRDFVYARFKVFF
jgi:hypothetical protein